MCGVFTMFGSSYGDDFDAALDALASRGPDERGVWRDPDLPDVRLGHRRLSIIDLAGGHQPMRLVEDDRYVVAYNGELYNFQALRKELEGRGRRFATASDTEVLLAGFAEWGEAVLPRLDGIFAFVVWDRVEREVFAARDRFGVKPLFWSASASGPGSGLMVGSTLAPFFALQGFSRRLDLVAMRDVLASQSVVWPRSILAGVQSLPPGGTLRMKHPGGEPAVGRFWEPPMSSPSSGAGLDFAGLVEATDAALRESVKRQLVSDVPLGAFLSGGIDSSLMVARMAEHSSGPVKTFSASFPFGKGYDESGAAAVVADAFGCEHHVLDAGEIDGEALALAAALLDQPLADPAFLPTLALSKLTREQVTVAISGDGGDELFGGYGRYLRGPSSYPSGWSRRVWRGLGLGGRRGLSGWERVLWDRVKLGPFPGSRKDLAGVFDVDAVDAAQVAGTMEQWRGLLDRFASTGGEGAMAEADTLMRADLHTYLSENCLAKTDRASMAHGLEVRVPLLGHPVADVALVADASVKLEQGLKSVLVALAKRDLPTAVWDRPKHGFSVPLRGYFAGAWKARCEDWVSRCGTLAPFLDAAEVRRRWHDPNEDARTKYTLVHVLAWLDAHDVSV